jgi:3-methyladenine DNA glycosylase AlkD
MNLKNLRLNLKNNSEKHKALIYQQFFKTRKGEYGEGDIFLGINVPKQRKIAKKYYNISLKEIQKLLNSKIHEERFIALIILIKKYETAKKQNNKKEQKNIFEFYLKNTKNINNWDLVDVSAPKIIGDYLLNNRSERKILFELAKGHTKFQILTGIETRHGQKISLQKSFIEHNKCEDNASVGPIETGHSQKISLQKSFTEHNKCEDNASVGPIETGHGQRISSQQKQKKGYQRCPDCQRISSLWEKRISIISTLTLIKNNDFFEALKLSKMFLKEEHNLLHKATGWMLREIGKKDEKVLKKFLNKNYKKMPRTMLRYAIERFEEKERKKYLNKK